MSSFVDNFLGGLTLGILVSNPFLRGMGGFGYGCGCGYGGVGGFIFGGMYNAVNLSGFANPFPSIFGGYGGGGYAASSGLIMPTGFSNPSFPSVDFSTPCQTIWDTFTDPDSDYNKRMRDWYEKMNSRKNPFSSVNEQADKTEGKTENKIENKTEKDDNNKSSDKTETAKKEINPTGSGTTTVSKPADTRASAKSSNNKNREFTQIYNSLGITDTRFQKIFEECVLNSEGREYVFDVHAMANSGVQQGTYDGYRKKKGLPKRDVKNMTETEMCEIYYNIYKDCGADKIKDDRMALYVFDVAVNSGSKKAKKLYKKSGGDSKKFENLRIDFYKSLATKDPEHYGQYLDGWLNRVKKTRDYADNNFSAIA